MTRQTIDCRDFPSEIDCSVSVAADGEDELLDAAAYHAVQVHKHTDSPGLRDELRKLVKAA